MVLSLSLALIFKLLFLCIVGAKDNASDSFNDRFPTFDYPTSETIFFSNDTLNETDYYLITTTVGNGESSESDLVKDNVSKVGKIDQNEGLHECGPPLKIEHARITGQNSPPYTIGTSLSYSCESGYSADRIKHTSECSQSSASSKPFWTDPQIRCNPRACGDPGFVANAERIGSQFTFPNSVSFECEEGYKAHGPKIRYCQVNGRWSGVLPTCEKTVCEAPGKPENGLVFFASLDYGSTLSYTCDKGFLLKNGNSRICSENGTWSGLEPSCVEANCDFPVAPEHGSVELVGEIPRIDSIARYKCEGSRKLVGSPVSKCLSIGEWTFPTPKCLEPCSVPSVSQGTIGRYERSRWSYYQKHFKPMTPGDDIENGEELFLRCKGKHEPLGKNKDEVKVFCDETGWREIPVCKPAQCRADPPETDNARTSKVDREHGGTVTYLCNPPFIKKKYGNVTCHFGTWRGFTPVCGDGRCYVDKMPFPGLQKDNKNVYSHRQRFKPSCMSGYEVSVPDNVFICHKGDWKGSFPPCKVVSCSQTPPSIEHGKIKSFNHLHNSSFVEYGCDDSYELTSSKVQCLFGEWKGTPPICKEMRCYFQDLKYKEGILVPAKDPTESGEPLEVQCASDYHKQNFETFCSKGVWEEAEMSPCKEMPCYFHDLKSKEGIQAPANDPTESSKSLEVQCASGYHELPLKPLCTKRGWVEAEVSPCKENSCSVHEIQNGHITELDKNKFERVRIGDIVDAGKLLYVVCLKDFSVQGLPNQKYVEIKCTRGKWNPTPICLITGTHYKEESEGETVAPRNSSTVNAEDVNSYTSSTPLTTASVLSTTPAPVSELPELAVESVSVAHCFCVYRGFGDLVAYVDNQRLVDGSKVKKNSTVKFHCKRFGYDRLIGSKELECKNCGPWNTAEYPRCDPPLIGDAIILYWGNFKILPGGVLQVNQGLNVSLTCFGERRGAYPIWTFPTYIKYQRRYAYKGIHYYSAYDAQYKNPYLAVLKIENASPIHNGQYKCYLDGYRHTSVQLEVKVQCRTIQENHLIVHYDDGLNVNSSALFTCRDKKKTIDGSKIVTCLQNGQWSEQPPTCINLCQELEETENMRINFTNGFRPGSKATFHCREPYERKGVDALVCLGNGKWFGKAPACIPPKCSLDDLYDQLPQAVTVDLKEETANYLPFGFEVNLTCDGNKRLSAPATARCGNKKWEIPATNCISGCEPIRILPGSQIIIEPTQDFYRFGEHVVLSCGAEQVLSKEVEVLMCLETGWSENEIPSCKDKGLKDA